ncbi:MULTISPECIES: DUF3027 domain-containing protein [Amycolatopsis]|nr:DUF3027 domain-containing protein [Amycolatopsis bullii]
MFRGAGAAAERGGHQQGGDDRRAHVEQPGTGAADACGTIGRMTLLLTLDDGSVQRKLADAVEFARAAVLEDAPEEQLGAHVGVTREDAVTASHLFEAQVPGYGGWRWSVTVAAAGEDEPVTVSEVVLVPGPSALVAPAWVPWERRVRAGDLGVGDIFPTADDDPRLAPAYLQSDDPAVEEVAREVGLGRVHTLSRFGRTEAAARWHAGEFGPRSDMARSAPDVCGTCGFFVPLAGSLRGVFGVCSNDIAPADGHVVDVEYGCGAHSEVEVELTSSVPVAELVYDDSLLDFTPAPEIVETAAAEPETGIAESDVSPAEVEPEAAAESVGSETAEVSEVSAAEPEAAVEPEQAGEPVAEAVAAEPASAVAPDLEQAGQPVAAEAEPVAAEAEPVAEAAPEAASAAEPEASVEAREVTEPGEAAEALEAVAPEAAASEAEPVATEAVASVSAEPVAAEAGPEAASAAAAEPEQAVPVASEAADPAGSAGEPVVAEVPEPAEAEPTQAEVTDAAEVRTDPDSPEVTAEPEAGEIPVAAESDAAEVDPVPAEVADLAAEPAPAEAIEAMSGPQEVVESGPAEAQDAVVPEPAEAEPTQAEVTDAVATPEAAEGEPTQAEVTDAAAPEAEPAPTDTGDAQEGELPRAALTGEVVSEALPADEAQAQVDDASER